jgi:hypothetical protein
VTALRELLTVRGLVAWAGTDRLSALPLHLPAPPYATETARLYGLFVAGETVELRQHSFPMNLVENADGGVRARVSILPLGQGLLVCDRLDADGGTNVVCWPDDSSYHLALAIPPGRRTRWLDLATGSAFAPILRPELAAEIVATDINVHAIRHAMHGLELSRIMHASAVVADLTAGIDGSFELVTCNAPIPADVGPLWRATADAGFFARLFDEVPRVLAPGGMFVLHAALTAVSPLVASLPGERVVVSYVPHGGRPFGILWWQPDGGDRHVVAFRELTAERPHLTHADRLVALDGT